MINNSINKNIFLTGSNGFIGVYLTKYFQDRFNFTNYIKNSEVKIEQDIVLHLAGKAHDLKNTSNPDEYYQINTELTKVIFDSFINSDAKVFITISSVKAVLDKIDFELTEETIPHPVSHYGISKLKAEEYILSKPIKNGKRVYILRPCMIHGPGNKGNLNLLYKIISKGIPWPLGMFENSRSYLSIENLCFIIQELIYREDVPSGVYNVADDIPLSTNEVINLIAQSNGNKAFIWNINMTFIKLLARVGDFLKLPLNSERLQKLTESFVVSNFKIKAALGKSFPISSKEGLLKTFQSFSHND